MELFLAVVGAGTLGLGAIVLLLWGAGSFLRGLKNSITRGWL